MGCGVGRFDRWSDKFSHSFRAPGLEEGIGDPEVSPTDSIVQVSRRRLYLLLGWAVLLALGASIYLGPYFAAWQIRKAVASGDAETLHEVVDFEAVRENLKSELRRKVGASRRAQSRERAAAEDGGTENSGPAPDLGAQLAVAVGEAMIDRFATPEGVDRALREGPAAAKGWSAFLNLGGDAQDASDGVGGVSVSASYEGWNDFAVRLGVERDPGKGEPLWADVLFERRGIWMWRVTGARVSPESIPLLTR